MLLLFAIFLLPIAAVRGKLDGDGVTNPCEENEIFTQCSGCERNCSRQSEAPNCRYGASPIKCGVPRCECAPQFSRSDSNGKCVRTEFCESPPLTANNENHAIYQSNLRDDDNTVFHLEKAEYNRGSANTSGNEVVGIGTVKALGI